MDLTRRKQLKGEAEEERWRELEEEGTRGLEEERWRASTIPLFISLE